MARHSPTPPRDPSQAQAVCFSRPRCRSLIYDASPLRGLGTWVLLVMSTHGLGGLAGEILAGESRSISRCCHAQTSKCWLRWCPMFLREDSNASSLRGWWQNRTLAEPHRQTRTSTNMHPHTQASLHTHARTRARAHTPGQVSSGSQQSLSSVSRGINPAGKNYPVLRRHSSEISVPRRQ